MGIAVLGLYIAKRWIFGGDSVRRCDAEIGVFAIFDDDERSTCAGERRNETRMLF